MNRLGISVLFAMLLSASGAFALGVNVSPEAIAIDVTRGGSVALLGVARERSYYMSRLVSTREILIDADGDGVIRHAPANGVSFSSIWIVIDLGSGEHVVGGPAGNPPLQFQPRGAGRGRAVEAIAGTLDVGRDAIDAIVVRPGGGAWTLTTRDGAPGDRDGRPNGRLRLDISAFRPLSRGSAAAPHALQPNDVVALVDADAMEYMVVTVAAGGN